MEGAAGSVSAAWRHGFQWEGIVVVGGVVDVVVVVAKRWHHQRLLLRRYMGMTDLMGGRRLDEVEGHLEHMWCAFGLVQLTAADTVVLGLSCHRIGVHHCRFCVLKGVDDIKESVRAKATSTLRMLGKMTSRLTNIEVSPESVVQRALDIALPFLLDKGINNEVQDVQVMCIMFAADMVKVRGELAILLHHVHSCSSRTDAGFPTQHCGVCLRPHTAKVVEVFLTAMSAFESQKLACVVHCIVVVVVVGFCFFCKLTLDTLCDFPWQVSATAC